jgi:NitT/TauT family transport system permease protein
MRTVPGKAPAQEAALAFDYNYDAAHKTVTDVDPVTRAAAKKARHDWTVTQVLRFVVLLAAIGLWQLTGTYWVDKFYVSTPMDVADRLKEWGGSSVLWVNLWATMKVTLLGFALGAVAGAVVGMILGINRRLASILDPWVQALYSIPKIALAPVFILWFGIGDLMRVVLTGMIVFFIVFWTAYAAVRSVERELIEVARLMGASRAHVIFKVVTPGSMPGVLHGFKMSIPYALIGAIIAELLASNQGIGYLMQRSASQYDTAGLVAGLVVLMVLAVLLNFVVELIDRHLTRWRA